MTKITMFKAIMVSWIRKDWSQSPNRGPNSIASSSVRRLSSTSGVISVPFWIMPADCWITCWLTSKTASTILKVFVSLDVPYNTRVVRSKSITGPYVGIDGKDVTAGADALLQGPAQKRPAGNWLRPSAGI